MSSTVATRTRRFAPPAVPTRKPAPQRRLAGDRAGVVGRTDRPLLRIVADGERAPVVTRITPVSPVSVVERSRDHVDLETRRVDLDDFFAPDYDGDDVRLEVATPRRSTVRLTHRGRMVVVGAGLAAAFALGLLGASHALAGDQPEPTRVVTVQPGQTLWDVASAVTPAGGDVRSTMSHLEAINHLDSAGLQVGQHLRVPR